MENFRNCNVCDIQINEDYVTCKACKNCDALCSVCKKPYKYDDLVSCKKCDENFCKRCSFEKPDGNPYFVDGWRMPDKYTCEKCSKLYFFAAVAGLDGSGSLEILSFSFFLECYPSQKDIIDWARVNYEDKLSSYKVVSYSELNRSQYEAFIKR